MSRNKITDLTPFVFEDGNVYYFQIFTFPGNYHDLFVYEKKKFFVKKWFFKKEVVEKLVQVGSSKLIKIDIGVDDLKSEICSKLNFWKKSTFGEPFVIITLSRGILSSLAKLIRSKFRQDSSLEVKIKTSCPAF